MSTAELVPIPERRSVVSPGSNGGQVNGDPTKLGEQLQRRAGSPPGSPPADRAPDLLEEFAATVAHELRTPLVWSVAGHPAQDARFRTARGRFTVSDTGSSGGRSQSWL